MCLEPNLNNFVIRREKDADYQHWTLTKDALELESVYRMNLTMLQNLFTFGSTLELEKMMKFPSSSRFNLASQTGNVNLFSNSSSGWFIQIFWEMLGLYETQLFTAISWQFQISFAQSLLRFSCSNLKVNSEIVSCENGSGSISFLFEKQMKNFDWLCRVQTI